MIVLTVEKDVSKIISHYWKENMILFQVVQFLAATALTTPSVTTDLSRRQFSSHTAVVGHSIYRGKPKHSAAGFIYGIADNASQIVDH